MKSIFMTTLESMCGAHDKSPWDDTYHALVFPDREGLDIVDYEEGW